MPFEVYQKRNHYGRAIKGRVVSLRATGMLVMSKDLYAAMGNPGRVELLWDAETRNIGMRVSDSENSYVVSDLVRSFYIKALANEYDVTLTDRHAEVGQDGDLWVFHPEAGESK